MGWLQYNNSSFNEDAVLKMSRNEFLNRGGLGNKLTRDQLGEIYDIINKKNSPNANSSQPAKITARTGLAKADVGVDGPNKGSTSNSAEGSDDTRY